MAFDKNQVVELLNQATVLELADLIDTLKEQWNVTAAVAVAGGGAAPVEAAAAQTEFDVVLIDAGSSKLNVIKEVRAITGLGLKEAKELSEKGGVIKEQVSKDEAEKIKAQLEGAGARVDLK